MNAKSLNDITKPCPNPLGPRWDKVGEVLTYG
jgi:hypothetical protein